MLSTRSISRNSSEYVFGKCGFIRKSYSLTLAKPEVPVALVIVDHSLVVELGRTDSECVVGIGRSQEEAMVFLKCFDQFLIIGGRYVKACLPGTMVESARQLGERSVIHKLLQMPIHGI